MKLLVPRRYLRALLFIFIGSIFFVFGFISSGIRNSDGLSEFRQVMIRRKAEISKALRDYSKSVLIDIARREQLEKSHLRRPLPNAHRVQKKFDKSPKVTVRALIDWHNYSQIDSDRKRQGLGEGGAPVPNPLDPGLKLYKNYLKYHAFNGYASDRLPVYRSLPDIRHPKCRGMRYFASLPTVSIIIPFHEEHLKTLVRTFVTAIKRAPEHLVTEVILVDDASTLKNLKGELDDYVKQYPKVRVMRFKKREGAIRARIEGIKSAKGDVIFILDSHCEANVNWLPPLLHPIAEDYRTVTCPFIDRLNNVDFGYEISDEGLRGAFNWQMEYKRLQKLPADEPYPENPFPSPVMAGGLYAISRRFYWEITGLDPKLEIWGGEQYDLSFKIWMCGGRMFDVPCSRFGHVYRQFLSFSNNNITDYLLRNNKRVAEIWMDEYKEIVYKRSYRSYANIKIGDITKDLKFRKTCRSFDWFMKNVAPDILTRYPKYIPDIIGKGQLRIKGLNNTLCVDFTGATKKISRQDAILRPCSQSNGDQKLLYDWRGSIRLKGGQICLEANLGTKPGTGEVNFGRCHNLGINQEWKYDAALKKLMHYYNLCLERITASNKMKLSFCDERVKNQHWEWESVNATAALMLF